MGIDVNEYTESTGISCDEIVEVFICAAWRLNPTLNRHYGFLYGTAIPESPEARVLR